MTTRGDSECPAVTDAEAIVHAAWLRVTLCERPAALRVAPRTRTIALALPRSHSQPIGAGGHSRPDEPSHWVWPRQRSPPTLRGHPATVDWNRRW